MKLIVSGSDDARRKSTSSRNISLLGQNFAKAFDVKFTIEKENKNLFGYFLGVSTRLMGALIMTHSDDFGLVLPPKLAPIQVVIVPIFKGEEQLAEISVVSNDIFDKLKSKKEFL